MTAWIEVPIGDVMASFFDGPHATPKPSEDGPIYLGIKNMTEDGHLDLSQVRHIGWEDFSRWIRRVEPKPGDLVFTYEASLHRYAMIPPGFKGCLGRRTALIRPDEAVIDGRFLLYQFLGPRWRSDVMQRINVGSTVDRISLLEFPKFPIRLPPLPVQRKIAAVLGAYDELIENNLRRIAILEEMAQAVYREWFVEFRFPGHEDVALVDSPLGSIPDGWEVRPLGELADFRSGGSTTKASFVGEGFIAFSASGPDGRLPDFDIEGEGVVISAVGANCGRTWLAAGRWSAIANTIRFLPKQGIPAVYLFLATNDNPWPKRGSAQPFVSINDCRAHLMTTPPHELLCHFGDTIRPMYALVRRLMDQNSNLRVTRDLLLTKLVSGELDVSGLDIDTEWLAS